MAWQRPHALAIRALLVWSALVAAGCGGAGEGPARLGPEDADRAPDGGAAGPVPDGPVADARGDGPEAGAQGGADDRGAGPDGRGHAPPPDVLIVSLDTLRADALSCYGNPRDTSPVIDGLAARGVRFERCFAPAPHTAPSHMSLFTGLLPAAHGVSNQGGQHDHVKALHPRRPTIFSLASRAGWQVIAASEGGQLQPVAGFFRGVDDLDTSGDSMESVTRRFARLVRGADAERPLVAFFHTYEVHAPYLPPAQLDGVTFHGRYTDPAHWGLFRQRYEALTANSEGGVALAARFLDPFDGMGEDDLDYLAGLYHEGVAHADHRLARVLELWGRERDLDNTLVVVLSDHGEQLGERGGSLGHHQGVEPELTHVPLVLVGPGLEPRVVPHAVGLPSVAATVLEFLGLEPEPHMSPSVLDLARGASQDRRPIAHLQDVLGTGDVIGAVRGSLFVQSGRARGATVDAAFDLASDPRGLVELGLDGEAAGSLLELARHRRLLDERTHEHRPHARLALPSDPDYLRQLRALGYLDGEER